MDAAEALGLADTSRSCIAGMGPGANVRAMDRAATENFMVEEQTMFYSDQQLRHKM
jgi:hypothetical protein